MRKRHLTRIKIRRHHVTEHMHLPLWRMHHGAVETATPLASGDMALLGDKTSFMYAATNGKNLYHSAGICGLWLLSNDVVSDVPVPDKLRPVSRASPVATTMLCTVLYIVGSGIIKSTKHITR